MLGALPTGRFIDALRPPVVVVKDGSAELIVRRETEADLFATDVGL